MSSLNGFNGQQGRPIGRQTAEQTHGGQAPSNHPQSGYGNAGYANSGFGDNGLGQGNFAQPQSAPQNWQPQAPTGHYQQPVAPPLSSQQATPQQWAPQATQPRYPQQGYGQAPAAPDYASPRSQPAYGGLSPNPESYAPSFEPYSPAASPRFQPSAQNPSQLSRAANASSAADYAGIAAQANYGQPQFGQSYHPQAQPPQSQWPEQPSADYNAVASRGFDANNYMQQPTTGGHGAYRTAEQHPQEPVFANWAEPTQPADGYDYGDANGNHYGQGHEQHDEMGFAQPAGGELDQGYADEDVEEYEVEETGRGRRPLMIAAALAGAIFVGGGMAYGYKAFLGSGPAGQPPVVKSASEPSKIKPADAGGKQFAHTDSKILGRLGEGSATASAAAEADPNGARKVSTLVVGRDGSIQPPVVAPAAAPPPPPNNVAVPGMMVVDALGGHGTAVSPPAPVVPAVAPVPAAAPAPQKLVVTPPEPPKKPVTIAKALPDAAPAATNSTGSIAPAAAVPAPAAKPAAKKVAAAKPEVVNDAASALSPAAVPTGANGYVAVLASVPRSDSSRMTALKRFADMQQKYGTVLNGRTPDVAEANLGSKGAYHRLVVGPPASRQQAATLCTDLKAQGYTDCWVTAY